jgi:hypothetical protein
MKQKAALLAIFVVLTASPVAAAEGPEAKKTGDSGQTREEAGAPAGNYKLDLKELFGCEPMGEDGHKMTPEPASEKAEEASSPAQEQGRTK